MALIGASKNRGVKTSVTECTTMAPLMRVKSIACNLDWPQDPLQINK